VSAWHVEVIEPEEVGGIMIREWHAIDCSALDGESEQAPRESEQ
jgi:hypothetical protein